MIEGADELRTAVCIDFKAVSTSGRVVRVAPREICTEAVCYVLQSLCGTVLG